jgi:hypothetical protein
MEVSREKVTEPGESCVRYRKTSKEKRSLGMQMLVSENKRETSARIFKSS